MPTARTLVVAFWGLVPAACADVAPANSAALGEVPATSVAEPLDAGSSTGDTGSTGTGGPEVQDERLDVPVPLRGCQKIDFLFVIDDSPSMGDEQARLIGGFPGFVAEIQDTISQFDYHIMAVKTGADMDSFDPCEQRLGGGRVRNKDGEDCGLLDDFLSGKRYIDSRFDAESGALEEAFACIADVGEQGDGDERTVLALAESMTTLDGVGRCNEGFLREDALLVVTVISDEEDSPDDGPPQSDNDLNSPGDPELWREGLIALKGGIEDSIVLLALVGDTDMPDAVCESSGEDFTVGAEPAPRLRALAESFKYGSWTSVCSADYGPFFNEAVDAIDNACQDYVPPG